MNRLVRGKAGKGFHEITRSRIAGFRIQAAAEDFVALLGKVRERREAVWAAAEQIVGDLNGDNQVTLEDLTILLSNFGLQQGAEYIDGDLDVDGEIDLSDLSLMLAHFGEICP